MLDSRGRSGAPDDGWVVVAPHRDSFFVVSWCWECGEELCHDLNSVCQVASHAGVTSRSGLRSGPEAGRLTNSEPSYATSAGAVLMCRAGTKCCGLDLSHVAEVEVSKNGGVHVRRVICAVDCGTVVNPDIVQAQIQSGINFGITAALYGEITLRGGRVEQSNFDTYQMLRIDEAPAIEVHIVESLEPPGGMGETGTSAIVPAVANAIFAATGKRLRKMPVDVAALKQVQ